LLIADLDCAQRGHGLGEEEAGAGFWSWKWLMVLKGKGRFVYDIGMAVAQIPV
jgi:hypothetical protein